MLQPLTDDNMKFCTNGRESRLAFSVITRAFLGGQATNPEDQNEKKMKKSERNSGK